MIYLKIIPLFLSFFLMYNFHLSLAAQYCFVRWRNHFSISSCWIGFRRVFRLYFQVFSIMLSVVVKEWKFCFIQFRFVLWSKKLTRFCLFNFLEVSHAAKKKYNFLYSYKLYASSWVIFVDISLNKRSLETWSYVCCYCAYGLFLCFRSLFQITPGNWGWVADSLMRESMG